MYSQVENCVQTAVVTGFAVTLRSCVDNGCGMYGECVLYNRGGFYYSSCRCYADYRGYGCTDDSMAKSDKLQMASVLLLTLSNLLFIPAIVVSCYRHFWVHALSYAYTMFFSTFYHACDGDRRYTYCIMPYNVLSYCDFFGAIMSVWVTIICMSRLSEKNNGFMYMLASLGLSIGVTWNRYSLWTFMVPIVFAIIVMTISWSRRCYGRKTCYPGKKRWLLYFVPGLLFAGTGLIVYAFFETEANYWYTHSTWHACMALCIVFFLPPRNSTSKIKIEILPPKPADEKLSLLNAIHDKAPFLAQPNNRSRPLTI